MTTVLETNATQAISPAVSAMQDIPLLQIQESKTNPRRLFDETKLTELADFVPRNRIGIMFPNFLCDLSLAAPVTLSLIRPYGFVSDSTSRSDFVFGSMTRNLAGLSP